jgi:hypothetical protein
MIRIVKHKRIEELDESESRLKNLRNLVRKMIGENESGSEREK